MLVVLNGEFIGEIPLPEHISEPREWGRGACVGFWNSTDNTELVCPIERLTTWMGETQYEHYMVTTDDERIIRADGFRKLEYGSGLTGKER